MMQNLVDFHSIVTYTIVAVSAGLVFTLSIRIVSHWMHCTESE